jgi:hypothetical protein
MKNLYDGRGLKPDLVAVASIAPAAFARHVSRMRFISLFAALALLSACATAAPTTAPAPSATPAAPAVAPSSRAAQLLSAAGRPNAPSQADVERLFGHPDLTRHDGAGSALTYRLESCALLLLFTADAHNTMRLNEAHPSARHPDQSAPSLDQCAAEASARRS